MAGSAALKKMHDAPGVLSTLQRIKTPSELAQVIEALLDAVPITSREQILHAVDLVLQHERKARMR